MCSLQQQKKNSPSPLHPHGSWNLESFPSTPDSYSEVGDFSSSSSYAALDWMHHPHSHPFNYNSAYSGSSGLNSGLTSPASCFSLDEEWAATSNARWFGPLCDTPGQTRPPSPGLQLSRTLSLPDAEYHSGRRTSVTQDLEQPVSA